MKPKDYYFCLDKTEEGTIAEGYDLYFFIIVSKKFWDRYQCLDDRGGDPVGLPGGFYECAESIFEYNGNPLQGREELLRVGFVENIEIGESPYTEENHEEWIKVLSPFSGSTIKQESENAWSSYSIKNLKIMLNDAVEKEKFELAAEIRDEINKRKKL